MTPREPSIGELADDIAKLQETMEGLPDRLDQTFVRKGEWRQHADYIAENLRTMQAAFDRQFDALKVHADGARATAMWAIGLLGAAILAGLVALLTRGAA